MRFEAKHQHFKQLAGITKNFTNIDKSLATRHQFLSCFYLNEKVTNRGYEPSGVLAVNSALIPAQLVQEIKQYVMNDCIPEQVLRATTMTLNSVKFRVNSVLVIDFFDGTNIPILARVTDFLKLDGAWMMCCKVLCIKNFNTHFHAYELTDSSLYHLIEMKEKKIYQVLDLYIINETQMVTLKHSFLGH